MGAGVRAIILIGVILRLILFFVFWDDYKHGDLGPMFSFQNIFETSEYSFHSFLEAIALENTGNSPYETGVFHMNPVIFSILKVLTTSCGPIPHNSRHVSNTAYFAVVLCVDTLCALCLSYIFYRAQTIIGYKSVSDLDLSSILTALYFLNPYVIGPCLSLCCHNILLLVILYIFVSALEAHTLSTTLFLSLLLVINPIMFLALCIPFLDLLHHSKFGFLKLKSQSIPQPPPLDRVLSILYDSVGCLLLSIPLFVICFILTQQSASFLWFSTAASTGGAEALLSFLSEHLIASTPFDETATSQQLFKGVIPSIPRRAVATSLSPSLSAFWYLGSLAIPRFKPLYAAFCSLNVVFYGLPIVVYLQTLARSNHRDAIASKVSLPLNVSQQFDSAIMYARNLQRHMICNADDKSFKTYCKEFLLLSTIHDACVPDMLPPPLHSQGSEVGKASVLACLFSIAFVVFYSTNCTSASMVLGVCLLFVDQQAVDGAPFSFSFVTALHVLLLVLQQLTSAWLARAWGNPNYAFGIQVAISIVYGVMAGEIFSKRITIQSRTNRILHLVRIQKNHHKLWVEKRAASLDETMRAALSSQEVRRRLLSDETDEISAAFDFGMTSGKIK
eukprot:GDKJ01017545.1.p1 GENE.GDKJ01017545.1~~GDKJ01017545.1.p1  ORF type:complete len:617 (+),score=95.66 GDKJ01017545.1:1-1851(+)